MTASLAAPALRVPSTWLVAGFLIAAQILWVGASEITNTALFPDAAEQFIWSKSIEWGYYKHPPLTTWLFAGAIGVFGPHPWVAGTLSGACLAATGLVTWAVARQLVGPRLAFFAVLLWSLQQTFSLRAYLYNHNIPLVLTMALCTWAVITASRQPERLRWWGLTGLAAGLAMLVKYQALLPMVGIAWALWRSGTLARRGALRGVAAALAVALLVFAPHAFWLATHDAPPLQYAANTMESLTPEVRLHQVVAFTVLQLRTLLPALLCAGLWLAVSRRVAKPAATRLEAPLAAVDNGLPVNERRAWLEGLIAVPLLLVVAACALGGVHLQGQWGMQSLQFASIGIAAWGSKRTAQLSYAWGTGVAIAVHLIGVAVVIPLGLAHSRSTQESDHSLQYGRAQLITNSILADWRKETHCPLRYVVGDSHLAGLVSAYSGVHPYVLEGGDMRKSPWIDLEDMRKSGSVHITVTADQLPTGAIHRPDMTLPPIIWRRPMALIWGIVPPTVDCKVQPPAPR